MKIKIMEVDEKHLKDYLIIAAHIKDMPESKLELVLNKYRNVKGFEEKEEIQRILIENNLKVVINIANRYRGAGLSFAKLIKAGNRGLIRAVKKWDEKESFAQFLNWSVEGAIIDALIKTRKIVQKKR